jgi:hypothetical protein
MLIPLSDCRSALCALGWPEAEIIYEDGGNDPRDYVFSTEKFSRQIGSVKYTPLPEGLRATIDETYGAANLPAVF